MSAVELVTLLLSAAVLTLTFALIVTARRNRRLAACNRALGLAKRASLAERANLQSFMDMALHGIIICESSSGSILYINELARTSLPNATHPNGNISAVIPALAPDRQLARELTEGRILRGLELAVPASSPIAQTDRWLSIAAQLFNYELRSCMLISLSDISDRKAAQLEVEMLSEQRALVLSYMESLQYRLREASLRDGLTGLHNRRYFDSAAPREFARCRRGNQPVGMLVVDADHFKVINDRFGHPVGDEVLRALGSILATTFRTEDLVCRIGGEEFVVLLPGMGLESTLARAEALREKVAGHQMTAKLDTVRVTVSVGAAVWEANAETPEELLARADAAVYLAKVAGRNRVVMAEPPPSSA